MRRLDGIERIAAEAEGRPHRDDVAWMFARIRRLEEALRVQRREHGWRVAGSGGSISKVCLFGDPRLPDVACDCGAAQHNAAIDAALKEDP